MTISLHRWTEPLTLFTPEAIALFHAPSHRKMALNTDKINVGPGGKRTKMCATVWDGAVQHMVDESGTQKKVT